jgi:hypothetical protein
VHLLAPLSEPAFADQEIKQQSDVGMQEDDADPRDRRSRRKLPAQHDGNHHDANQPGEGEINVVPVHLELDSVSRASVPWFAVTPQLSIGTLIMRPPPFFASPAPTAPTGRASKAFAR